ncbi:hypothetical protein DTO195F2_7821 [Paecilomyces variotii]|nr:hypothetical protein DTO195F2_7821 [Paecilomyces variotii]KAJ9355823.1 hypothetical protein DTO027B9_3977 [Paecilomyces variotii]KAJ9366294.1 hypothetical protein DTO282E5_9035 [Paecilomyces variotii]
MLPFGSFTRQALRGPRWSQIRSLSTLDGYPYIYVFRDDKTHTDNHVLSLLPTEPPNSDLSIGTTNELPPTPASFKENPSFLRILQDVLSEHAHEDPEAVSQAQIMASTSGANLGSGGVFFAPQQHRRKRPGYGGGGGAGGDSSGGASGQGGAGSGGRGGWIHISDSRNPPEYGRIASPEDIFGSLEVDSNGGFVGGNGNYQPSGTYRIVTRNGILGLSPFLREKLVQRLRAQDKTALWYGIKTVISGSNLDELCQCKPQRGITGIQAPLFKTTTPVGCELLIQDGVFLLHIEVSSNQLVVVTAIVSGHRGDGQSVNMHIKDALGNEYGRPKDIAGETRQTFTSLADTAFDVCFENQLVTRQAVANPSRHIELDIDIGADARDWNSIQAHEKLKPVETDLRRIEELVSEIVNEMEYLRLREQRLRDTNESTNERVKWFAIGTMGMLVGLGAWQVVYLRAYFRSKHLI